MEPSIDSRLERRSIAPMRRDFTADIVSAALKTPQRRPVRLGEWVSRLFGEFSLPQPAYALAGMLFMGVLLGYMNPAQENTAAQSLAEMFDDEGAVL